MEFNYQCVVQGGEEGELNPEHCLLQGAGLTFSDLVWLGIVTSVSVL